jgi:hypothetical protein
MYVKNGDPSWLAGFSPIRAVGSFGNVATTVKIDHAVALANVRKEIPLEHLLLRDAWALLNRADTRRGVIDAASASEVSLSTSIRSRLKELGASEE